MEKERTGFRPVHPQIRPGGRTGGRSVSRPAPSDAPCRAFAKIRRFQRRWGNVSAARARKPISPRSTSRRAAQTPRGRRRKRLSAPGPRTAAPSLSDIPGRLVGLGEPRLLVPVPARCDQRYAGDGGGRSRSRIFTSPSFSDRGSALAGERVVVAPRDRRHRTRRAGRSLRSVAFSAAGATCRRPGRENRFPLARLLGAPRKRPEVGSGNGYPSLAGERLRPACRTSPDDLSGSARRVCWCRSQLAATNGTPATAVSARGAEFLQVRAFPTADPR